MDVIGRISGNVAVDCFATADIGVVRVFDDGDIAYVLALSHFLEHPSICKVLRKIRLIGVFLQSNEILIGKSLR